MSHYSRVTRRFFDCYLKWNFKKHFSQLVSVDLSHLRLLKEPILFVANHVSWWDGFFLFELQRRIRPKGQIYTIALEKTCVENPILPRLGVLPLEPGRTNSVKNLLSTLKSLRQEVPEDELIISFFPQGKIGPSFLPDLEFERGIEAVLSCLTPVQLVPIGIHIEPMIGKKPTAILSVGNVTRLEGPESAKKIQRSVQDALQSIHQSLYRDGEKIKEPFQRLNL